MEKPPDATPIAEREPERERVRPRSARRRSREFAVQAIYQWLVSKEDSGAIEAHISAVTGFDRADREHFKTLLYGVIRDAPSLHASILPHIDRPIVELSPVEHAILLIGGFELLRHLEIPYRVVINEAVELAKTYGGTDGYKYVNGVLDRVAADLRPLEGVRTRG
jgi:transcription antitermination protein NusB